MLMNAVRHHVEEEEANVFPKMEAQLSVERLKDLQREMWRRKQDLLPG